MKFILNILIGLLAVFMFFSCDKEPIDSTEIIVDEVDVTVVSCGLMVRITNDEGLLRAIASDGAFPYSFEWSTGDTTPIVRVVNGTYEVTVTDAEDCIVIAIIEVNDADLCNSLDFTITTNSLGVTTCDPSGGTPPYRFIWSTFESKQSVNLDPGDYSVTVVDSENCRFSKNFTATITGLCTGFDALVEFMVNSDTTGYALKANIVGGTPPFTYTWNSGETSPVIPFSTNPAFVTITDSEGCVACGNFELIDGPCLSMIAQDRNTLTAVIFDGIPPYTYEWSTGETTETITVSAVGEYTVTITDRVRCMTTGWIEVSTIPCSDFNFSYFHDEINNTLRIDPTGGTPPYSIRWLTGETTFEIPVSSGNLYTAELMDADGCALALLVNIP